MDSGDILAYSGEISGQVAIVDLLEEKELIKIEQPTIKQDKPIIKEVKPTVKPTIKMVIK